MELRNNTTKKLLLFMRFDADKSETQLRIVGRGEAEIIDPDVAVINIVEED